MPRELSPRTSLNTGTASSGWDVVLVAVGGSVGTLCRHLLDRLTHTFLSDLPVGTFLANISGAFLLGLLVESLSRRGADHGRRRDLRLLLGTGLLGGYTTYSALANDTADMLLSGQGVAEAVVHASVTVVSGVLSCWAGVLLARTRGERR